MLCPLLAAVEPGHIVSWKTREKGKNYNVACEQSLLHCPLYSFYLILTFSSNIFSLPPHTGPPWSTSVSLSLNSSSLLEGASLPARTEMLWTKKLRVGNPRGPLSSPPGGASRSISLSVSCHRANWSGATCLPPCFLFTQVWKDLITNWLWAIVLRRAARGFCCIPVDQRAVSLQVDEGPTQANHRDPAPAGGWEWGPQAVLLPSGTLPLSMLM